ncbi:hypothetical protein DFH27DRAFT_561944 [Peziza echinospora]|nr:hypothetical protein DFH27DRAFT_561944 [Peziza echinospora]
MMPHLPRRLPQILIYSRPPPGEKEFHAPPVPGDRGEEGVEVEAVGGRVDGFDDVRDARDEEGVGAAGVEDDVWAGEVGVVELCGCGGGGAGRGGGGGGLDKAVERAGGDVYMEEGWRGEYGCGEGGCVFRDWVLEEVVRVRVAEDAGVVVVAVVVVGMASVVGVPRKSGDYDTCGGWLGVQMDMAEAIAVGVVMVYMAMMRITEYAASLAVAFVFLFLFFLFFEGPSIGLSSAAAGWLLLLHSTARWRTGRPSLGVEPGAAAVGPVAGH